MFKHFVCWDASGATKILRPLALEGNEAVFRATHSPISGLMITGTEAHDVSDLSEQGLLTALSSPTRRHAMCVVEGEAGSGKSHLIRWLKVNWKSKTDLVVLIERTDGTLEGTLRQLKEKLSREVGASLDSIVPRHKLTEQGQRGSLLLQLGNLCRSGTLADPLGDENWCETHGLSDMLQSEAVRMHWKAPDRVLEVLTRGADRDSTVARFTSGDVLDLKQHLAGLRGRNVGPGAIRLARLLREESQGIASVLEATPPGCDDADISLVAPHSSRFLTALNSRLSLAIQSAMGISGAALQNMFREVRRTLKEEGRRLVVLLEDFTGAQGVDQELLYVLQERSTTQAQFCDIVSVIGITPAYFRQHIGPQANVVQRITHHVRFGSAEGSFQDVSALAGASHQVAFASRYLRAVRAGMEEIDQASKEDRSVVNRCVACPHKPECHLAFGEHDNVGLYPLTAKAIVRMFSALRHPQGTMLLQTPRAMIQGVLAPSIAAASEIEAGRFPVPSIETEWHQKSLCEVHGLAHELIEMTAPEEDRERLRRTVSWWGDGGFSAMESPGEWAGVPEGVFRAWSLPKPPAKLEKSVEGTMPPGPGVVGENKPGEQPEDPGGTGPGGKKPGSEGSNKIPGVRSSPKTKVDEQLQRLRAWTKDKKIEDDGFWSRRAHAFIETIGWKNEDIPHWFASDALGEVRLEGSGKTDHRNVVIPCSSWAARGLEWSARLEHSKLSQGEHEVAVQAISVFARRVRQLVAQWIFSRVPEVKLGRPWPFEATVAQVLLSRAWFRGETRPGAPLVEQWKAILSDDPPSGAVKRPGAVGWNHVNEQLAGDASLHKRLRTLTECGEAIADVSSVVSAIRSLAETAQFADFPAVPPEQPQKAKWLSTLASSAVLAQKALTDLPSKEIERLRSRAALIRDTAGSNGFAVYIARAASAFERVRQGLPNHAASELSEWFRIHAAKQGLLKPGPGSDHDRVQAFLAARALDSLPADASVPILLEHAIATPAESLEGVHGLVKDTSALVHSLVDYLAGHEKAGANIGDAGEIVEFGKRIAEKAEELKAVLS